MKLFIQTSISIVLFFLFAIPASYGGEDPSTFKDWEVSNIGGMILYSAHGENVHGHRFGWLKRAGSCNQDILYLTYSSYNENINVLEKLTKNTMPLKVIFPQTEGVTLHILPEIIGLTGLGNMKIVTLSNMRKEKVMDAYFSKLNAITIEIEEPYTSLFDITFDNWSLNGYVAAKLKAQEMCEGLTMKRDFKVALNH